MFTEAERNIIMLAVIKSAVDVPNELQDKLEAYLRNAPAELKATSDFVEVTNFHDEKILLNRRAIQRVYTDAQSGICCMLTAECDNALSLRGSYEDIKKILVEG